MRSINTREIFLVVGGVMLLAGCESMGTSSAGYSPQEDAYQAPPAAKSSPSSRSMVAGTSLFERGGSGPVYGTSPFPPGPAEGAAKADRASDFDNLEIVSPALKGKLDVMRVGSQRTDDNLLSVFAGLKNKSTHELPLEVETIYKDNANHPLTTGKGWISITLHPHEETQYRSVAISEDASDFVVRVRRATDPDSPQH